MEAKGPVLQCSVSLSVDSGSERVSLAGVCPSEITAENFAHNSSGLWYAMSKDIYMSYFLYLLLLILNPL